MESADAGPVFEIVHWVEAPIDEVYAFFTDAERMVEWHGVEAKLDPTPGGLWWVRHANGSVLSGRFVSLDPPHALAFTWGFESPAETTSGNTPSGGSRVEVRLTQEGSRTRIDLRHSQFDPGDAVGEGWSHFLPQMKRRG